MRLDSDRLIATPMGRPEAAVTLRPLIANTFVFGDDGQGLVHFSAGAGMEITYLHVRRMRYAADTRTPVMLSSDRRRSGSIADHPSCTSPLRGATLFVERLGRSPTETRAKIEKAFQQLFHGDARPSESTSGEAQRQRTAGPTSPTGPTTTRAPKA